MTKHRSQSQFQTAGTSLARVSKVYRQAVAKASATTLQETENADQLPSPPEAAFHNLQLELFQSVLANNDEQRDKLSHLIDLWDSVPRYSVSRAQMTKLRVDDEFLREHETTFQHRQRSYRCVIYPARVKDAEDSKFRDFYPSANEELVEDALRKMAVERDAGYFDQPNYRSGVQFTLYALSEELSRRGKTRSNLEIVQSLNILSRSIVDIIPDDGSGNVAAPCFPTLARVTRKMREDDPDAKWAVQFHPLVTGAIDQVTHRQFNYAKMMSHKSQLTRWLHKKITLNYTFADYINTFEMRYSTIKRDSGLLNHKRERGSVELLEEAFTALVEAGVISAFKRKNETGPRDKILDAVFTIFPHADFIREAKAANKRQRLADEKLGRVAPAISVGIRRR